MKKMLLILLVLAFHFSNSMSFAETQGYVLSTSLWDQTNIPVCWECGGFDTEKKWVKDAVVREWEANSVIKFTGWGRCPKESGSIFPGIRINVRDEVPHTTGCGKALKGKPDGMVLNFTFNEWCSACNDQFHIEAIAVHEFGHALGLAHEQNREDTPGSCTESPQGTDGDVMVGPWDSTSIMNYCNSTWNNGGELSNGDIATINWAYPAKLEKPINKLPTINGRNVTLKWNECDPYQNETVYYNVYLGTNNPPTTLVAQALSQPSYTAVNLRYNTKYYAKIVAVRGRTFDLTTLSTVGLSFSTYGNFLTGRFPTILHNVWGFLLNPDNSSFDWSFIYQDGYTIARVSNPIYSIIQTPTIINGDVFGFEIKPVISPILDLLLLN